MQLCQCKCICRQLDSLDTYIHSCLCLIDLGLQFATLLFCLLRFLLFFLYDFLLFLYCFVQTFHFLCYHRCTSSGSTNTTRGYAQVGFMKVNLNTGKHGRMSIYSKLYFTQYTSTQKYVVCDIKSCLNITLADIGRFVFIAGYMFQLESIKCSLSCYFSAG